MPPEGRINARELGKAAESAIDNDMSFWQNRFEQEIDEEAKCQVGNSQTDLGSRKEAKSRV